MGLEEVKLSFNEMNTVAAVQGEMNIDERLCRLGCRVPSAKLSG